MATEKLIMLVKVCRLMYKKTRPMALYVKKIVEEEFTVEEIEKEIERQKNESRKIPTGKA